MPEENELLVCTQNLLDGVAELIRSTVEQMLPILHKVISEILESTITAIGCILEYVEPSGRIRHLALHSRKWRVRKKNIKRMWRGDLIYG